MIYVDRRDERFNANVGLELPKMAKRVYAFTVAARDDCRVNKRQPCREQ